MTYALTVIYISGLILLDRWQYSTRMVEWLPARAHDALTQDDEDSIEKRISTGAIDQGAQQYQGGN